MRISEGQATIPQSPSESDSGFPGDCGVIVMDRPATFLAVGKMQQAPTVLLLIFYPNWFLELIPPTSFADRLGRESRAVLPSEDSSSRKGDRNA